MGLPRTMCDFVCILSVIAIIEFLSLSSTEELPTKAAVALNHALKCSFCAGALHFAHALTLYARAVFQPRFVTEGK